MPLRIPSFPRLPASHLDRYWLLQRPTARLTVLILLAEVALIAAATWAEYERLPASDPAAQFGDPPAPNRLLGAQTLDASTMAWGLNLKPILVPPRNLIATVPRLGDIPAIVDPPFTRMPEDIAPTVMGERIVGVSLGGESRAYPLNILDQHECINDTLGGEPIVVVRSPLGGGVNVYARSIEYAGAGEHDGETPVFASTGLMLSSNSIIADRRTDPHDASLWQAVGGRAIAGPAAARRLSLRWIDAELTTLGGWRAKHPESTIVWRFLGYQPSYERSEFEHYYAINAVAMPTRMISRQRDAVPLKAPLAIVRVGGATRGYPLQDMAKMPDRTVRDTLGGVKITLTLDEATSAVEVRRALPAGPDAPQPQRAYSYLFSWDAQWPRGEIYDPALGDAQGMLAVR